MTGPDPRRDADVIPPRARFRDGRCPCQAGACGHCRSDRHHDCTTTRHGPTEHPATYLIDMTGAAIAPVHETRTTHRWACACHTAGHPTCDPHAARARADWLANNARAAARGRTTR